MGLDTWFNKRNTNEIAYFRKVNFLVAFFEEKGMDVENQRPYEIRREDLEDLLDRCNEVIKNHDLAKVLLPTCSGFFFGPTDYDEYYFNNVEQVKKVAEQLLEEYDSLKGNEYITFDIWY